MVTRYSATSDMKVTDEGAFVAFDDYAADISALNKAHEALVAERDATIAQLTAERDEARAQGQAQRGEIAWRDDRIAALNRDVDTTRTAGNERVVALQEQLANMRAASDQAQAALQQALATEKASREVAERVLDSIATTVKRVRPPADEPKTMEELAGRFLRDAQALAIKV